MPNTIIGPKRYILLPFWFLSPSMPFSFTILSFASILISQNFGLVLFLFPFLYLVNPLHSWFAQTFIFDIISITFFAIRFDLIFTRYID